MAVQVDRSLHLPESEYFAQPQAKSGSAIHHGAEAAPHQVTTCCSVRFQIGVSKLQTVVLERQMIVSKVEIGVLKLGKGASKLRLVDFNLQNMVSKLGNAFRNFETASRSFETASWSFETPVLGSRSGQSESRFPNRGRRRPIPRLSLPSANEGGTP